jgi:hypothetical protein
MDLPIETKPNSQNRRNASEKDLLAGYDLTKDDDTIWKKAKTHLPVIAASAAASAVAAASSSVVAIGSTTIHRRALRTGENGPFSLLLFMVSGAAGR